MSRKVTCADNAPTKNFFGILKQEMYYGEKLVSYEELKVGLKNIFTRSTMHDPKIKLAGLSSVESPNQFSQATT
ncbi:MAG: IS3 family transposase [Bacillota bacterium]|uniref:IS3 family transposase n=1 Tax=unclassified Virgibacillus TaxID=2620237 RepID=UPI000EF45972|nr:MULTISPECIES: IS3 family transposase [unclassified Virgibacillus]MCC2248689.1 IS3 family transposase [Virgibacillus sp. AGTR]MDY7044981.1 IS3 family transposase [Virgibacillus sp. M23]QRZ18446.1 IS3 family transposase [Virgibacillus sp. AGTR]